MARRLLNGAARSTLAGGFIRVLERSESRRPNLLRILTYHHVDKPDRFEEHMSYLANHYQVVSIAELLEAFNGGVELPPRSIMITIDDAYQCFADHAWPVLKHFKLPATLFVPTAYPDQPDRVFWWDQLENAFSRTDRREDLDTPVGRLPMRTEGDRDRSLARVTRLMKMFPNPEVLVRTEEICGELDVPPARSRVLGWDALRKLATEGVSMGVHTRTHPILDRIPLEHARAEILESQRDLEREIGGVSPIFAYPDGGFSDDVVDVLRRSGCALAFTTRRGTNDLRHADRLRLLRINVDWNDPLPVLRARLVYSSVYLNRFRPLFDLQGN